MAIIMVMVRPLKRTNSLRAWGFRLLGLLTLLASSPAWAGEEVIVMLGDSLTAGGGSWSRLRPGAVVYNLGVPADTTMGVWARLSEVVARKPDYIFLQVGINELGQGLKIKEIVAGHERIWSELREKLPEAKVFVCSLIPIRESRLSYRPHRLRNVNIMAINRQLAQAAEKAGLQFINLYLPLLGPDGELPDNLTFDGVHLQPQAYEVWLLAIKSYLP
jgi:lysophospholipase L1-like esterase